MHEKKQQREVELTLFHAWHCAAFERTKQLPSLKSILDKRNKYETKPSKSPEEIFYFMKAISAAHNAREKGKATSEEIDNG